VFPNRGSLTGRSPSLRRVPSGSVPPLQRYYESAKTAHLAFPFASFPSLRVPPADCSFRPWLDPSPSALTIIAPGRGSLVSRLPTLRRLSSHSEPMSSPRFLGNPSRTFALLLDPGGCSVPGVTTRRCCSRNCYHESSRTSMHFEARSHGFCACCLRFALRSLLTRKTRFRPAANLYRAGFSPAGLLKEILVLSFHLPLLQAYPGAKQFAF